MSKISAVRYHDISCGHRVVGHGGRCRFMHGHNYRMTFHCEADQLDKLGMVVDFGVIKSTLCQWLEDNWDHKTLLWSEDPLLKVFNSVEFSNLFVDDRTAVRTYSEMLNSLVEVPFNPTAENIGIYLVTNIGPRVLGSTGVRLVKVEVNETRKCSAIVES